MRRAMFLVLCTRFYLVPGISKLWIFKRYPDEHCLQLGTSETVRFRSIVNFMVSKSNIVLNSLVMVLSNSSHPKLACLSIVGLSDKDERSTEKSNAFRILVAVVSVAASLVGLSYERPYLVLDPNLIMICILLSVCKPVDYTCKPADYSVNWQITV